MGKRGTLITHLWVLSLLALPLSNLPNRILLGLMLIWFLVKHRIDSFKVSSFSFFAGLSLVLLIMSSLSNKVLSKELLLGLSIPAQGFFLLISRPSPEQFKKGFHMAAVTVVALLLLAQIVGIVQIGFISYFEQDQWWNLWHYKSLTQSLSLHPTYLSLFLLVGMVLLLFEQETSLLKNSWNYRGLTLFAIYLIALWLISSKIALVSLWLILIIFWFHAAASYTHRQSFVLGLLLILAFTLPLTSPSIRHRLTTELNTAMQALPAKIPNRITERRALWKSSFIEMDRYPIAGTSFRGIKSRDAIYPKAKFFYNPLEKPMNAHNNFIEFGLRYGILFGALLLLTSIFGLYKAFRIGSLEMLSLGMVLITVSMTESFLVREQGLSLAALMLLFYGFVRK
jgi:O-antigen ligase